MRIIGGQWKRSVLPVPQHPGLRPTPDRVRETLFNWLGQDLSGWRVLDAFAGSGALGFEAASRGAEFVLLIERHAQLAQGLQATARRLGATNLTVQCADALQWLERGPTEAAAAFELVLLDPPFGASVADAAAQAALPWLVPGGWLYVESPEPLARWPDGLEPFRHLRAGAVHAQLLRRNA